MGTVTGIDGNVEGALEGVRVVDLTRAAWSAEISEWAAAWVTTLD